MIELTSKQLRRAADIQDKIESLQKELSKLLGGATVIAGNSPAAGAVPKKRKMSAAARKKIAAAQKARWAKVKASKK